MAIIISQKNTQYYGTGNFRTSVLDASLRARTFPVPSPFYGEK